MSGVDPEQLVAMLVDASRAPLPFVEAIQEHGLTALAAGRAATLADIGDQSGLSVDEIRAGVEALAQAGRIEIDGDDVIGVGGLTLSETDHALDLPTASLHTWCALDAIGIPAALGIDAEISTTCPYCGARLHVAVTNGDPQPAGAMKLLCPTSDCSDVRSEFCSAANLFCNAGHLHAWRTTNPNVEGAELDLDETAELGRAVWGRYKPDA